MAPGSLTDRARAEAMARRLVRTAGRLGIDPDGVDRMRRAFGLAMEPRFQRGLDDHHPDYLHTARTALILMDDARVRDPATLAAALVVETRDRGLVLPAPALEELGRDVAEIAAEVPGAAADESMRLERLVAASRPARLVAVAERLDHARHLQLREPAEWDAYHSVTLTVYAPLAHRTEPVLAGRLDWWCATFRDRFLAS